MLTDSYLEQVEKKRQRIEKVKSDANNDNDDDIKSSLPSRLELHHSKKRKKKTKIKFPLLKVLLTFFILLPISTILAYTYFSHQHTLKANTKDDGSEEISYESNKSLNGNNHGETIQINEHKEKTNSVIDKPSSQSQVDITPNKKDTADGNNTDEQNSTIQTNEKQEKAKTNVQIINHVVQPNETLFSISMKYYHSKTGIEQIIHQNNITNNEVQIGQTLQIPLTK